MAKRDIISAFDMQEDLEKIIDLSIEVKKHRYDNPGELKNRILGMIFEKPSTRTRNSLEVAIEQLGGHGIYLNPHDMQIGRGETVSDTAKVLSRFVDAISYRAFSNKNMRELADNASVPVINALDDKEHPVQIVADYMTFKERFGSFKGKKLAYVGDGNNMVNSLIAGAAILGIDISVATPKGYEPDSSIVEKSRKLAASTGSKIEILNDPVKAVENADAVYTDVWISMGDEEEREEREKVFKAFQVTGELMSHAKDTAIFLHCLPAHRGMEVTAEVMDGPQSAVFDQAENRLHTSKALLLTLIKKN